MAKVGGPLWVVKGFKKKMNVPGPLPTALVFH